MKTFLPLTAVLTLCQSAFAFEPIQFQASDGTPESQGWAKSGNIETPTGKEGSHTYLDVDDGNPADSASFQHAIDKPTATEAADAGFVFEVTARIEPSSGPSSQQAGFSIPAARAVLGLNSNDGKQNAGLINLNSNKPIPSSFQDSNFHTWKVVGKPTPDGKCLLSYYGDKQLVANDVVPLEGAALNLNFGSLGGNMTSRQGRVLYEKVVFRPLESGE